MKYIQYLAIFLFTIMCFSMPANASIRLSTEKFEFTAGQNTKFLTGAFTVQNDDKESVRFKIYPEYFEISEEGMILTGLNNKEDNLSKNIRFNPAEFTLTKNESQKIRFTISDINKLPDGESRAALFLEDAKTKQQALPSSAGNASANLVLKTRIAIPIYIEKGNVMKSGSIEKLKFEKFKNKYIYDLYVKSGGNSKIRVSGVGQIILNNELINEFAIPERPIQAGTVGRIRDILPTAGLSPNQNYTLKITLSYKTGEKTEFITQESILNLGDITKK